MEACWSLKALFMKAQTSQELCKHNQFAFNHALEYSTPLGQSKIDLFSFYRTKPYDRNLYIIGKNNSDSWKVNNLILILR